ncbi:MAG: hypothetical protein K2M64_02555 [Clostridia bacterium]|nr:hypothetical protein [Clostridia bacterium]
MKKYIALLLGVLLLFTGVFASCSTAVTDKTVRWGLTGNEKYQFEITLADFAVNMGTLFNSYTHEYDKEDGNKATYKVYKDAVSQSYGAVDYAGGVDQETSIMKNLYEVRPVDAKGTFTMEIVADSSATLTTTQVIYTEYGVDKLQDVGCYDMFKGSKYDVTGKDEDPFERSGHITLKSETTSTVVFANNANQAPISSVKENTGFYIGVDKEGKNKSCFSDYKYETTYDFDNRKVTVTKNNGEPQELKLDIAKGATCIDSAQLLLYIRSLDKSSSAFQDSPSIAVYNPVQNTLSNAVFALTRNFYLRLNNDNDVDVQMVSVSVGNVPFMTQFNLPDLTEKGLDAFTPSAGDGVKCKYTTIKFRSGWFSYELSAYDPQILSAIDLQNKVK